MTNFYILLIAIISLISCNDTDIKIVGNNSIIEANNSSAKIVSLETDKKVESLKDKIISATLCYSNNSEIFISKNGKVKSIIKGNLYVPEISPNGKQIAFTDVENGNRNIKIYDIETKNITPLDINDNNYYGPTWSIDGGKIAFNIMSKGKWQVGIINIINQKFELFEIDTDIGLHAPSWSLDNNYLLAHDLGFAYKYNLTNRTVDTLKLDMIDNENLGLSSSSKLLISADNNYLIFAADLLNEKVIRDFHGPLSAIHSYNFKTKKIKRLSPKDMYSVTPWINKSGDVYFSGRYAPDKVSKIYKTDFSGSYITTIVKNARFPSLSR